MENSDTCDNGKVNEYFLYDIVEEEFSKYYENLVLSRDNHPDIHQEAYHLCRICNSKFEIFDKLNCHSLHHFIERKYHCRKCLFFGRSIKSLGDHAKKIHTNSPYIRCPYCGRSFNILDHLPFESHIKTHFQYKNQLEMMGARNLGRMFFICMTCGKVFWHKNQLTDHVAAEKNVRESTKPLSSSRAQPLTPQTLLVKHKKTIAENSYKCNICGETFTNKSNYSEHFDICKAEFLKRSKRSRPPKFARKPRKTSDDGVSERFKTVKIICAACNETCTLNRQLRRHIRMGHVEFLYICKTCGHVAQNEKSMMKHSQKHINPCSTIHHPKKTLAQQLTG
uniref:C2H2-type domain-containing protein n=2 Tax=Lutzomyia longipalpis TaxID=7200 RepID=A0A1B0GKU4_LUTLO